MEQEKIRELIRAAFAARENAYCEYSHFAVGAALLAKDGEIYHGCNVENISYGATICAERNAFFQAVAKGKRDFKAIAIVGGLSDGDAVADYAYPCGMCLQVMSEFCKDDFLVIVAKSIGDYQSVTLKELLPKGFAGIR